MTDAACVAPDELVEERVEHRVNDDDDNDDNDDDEPVEEPERADTSHLDDLEDGCGCAEVWEHLSERRGE